MKLQLKVKQISEAKGIKTAYQLQQKAKLSPATAYRLFNDSVSTITMETLEKVCTALECDPGDLFLWSNKIPNSKKSKRSKS
jgi:DNA-binding Xre family transcriptional regulator